MPSLLHPTLRDISPGFTEEMLKDIARQVQEEFKPDAESCAEWRKMHADWIEIYYQKDRTKKPFEGASEDCLPILAEACDQFHARASKAMFPARGKKIIRCVPTGAVDPMSIERARRVEKYIQWQLCGRSTGYRQAKDAMLMMLPLHGCVFTKTYLDPVTGRLTVKNVRATDMIVPYGAGQRCLEDLPRKTEIQWIPVHHANQLTASGFFNGPLTPWGHRGEMVDRNPADDVVDDIMGFQESRRDASDYCLILEQHRFLDIDGDGIEEPYTVWLDAISQNVVRVQIRYETDAAGVPADDKSPMECFTQFDFAPNPNGLYGIGHGLKIGAVNHAINRLLRINLDSAMLAAVGNASGIINKSIGIKKGELELKLGKFITTETPIEDIRTQVFPFSFPGPNAAGISLMELLAGRADRLAMITEAVTGQTQSVMQPTTVLALLDQSNIVFTASFERVMTAWESELAKVYRTNRMYLNDTEYFVVIDANEPMLAEVSAADFEENFQIQLVIDPDQLTLKERLAKAQATYQASMSNPVITQSPMHMRNALVQYLEALEVDLIDEIVPTPEMVMAWMQQQAQTIPPEIQLEQARGQVKIEETMIKAKADAEKMAAELKTKTQADEKRFAAELEAERAKASIEIAKAEADAEAKANLERAKAVEARKTEMARIASQERIADADREVEMEKLRLEADRILLEAEKIGIDPQTAEGKLKAAANKKKADQERQANEKAALAGEFQKRDSAIADIKDLIKDLSQSVQKLSKPRRVKLSRDASGKPTVEEL